MRIHSGYAREVALMALFGRPNVEHLKATGNIPGLIKALVYKGRDASWIRKAAIEALGELRATAAVEPLLQALEDPHGDIRILAAGALRAIGDARTLALFIRALRDPSSAVQEQAALALEYLNDPRAVPPLLDALQTNVPQGEKRPADRAIAHAIVALAPTQAEPLIAVLRNKKREAWEEAAIALLPLHDQRAVDPLGEVALDNETTRQTALSVLEELGWHPTEEGHWLIQALAARQWEDVETFGADAIDPLLATLRVSEEPDAQERAMALLVKLGSARAVGALVDLVRDAEHRAARLKSNRAETASRSLSAQTSVQQSAIHAIEVLLEQVAANVPTEGLRKVLLLRDELSLPSYRTPQERAAVDRALFGPESVAMPRVHVKHLAHLELQRRGQKA
jgi:HEAT repeat protein